VRGKRGAGGRERNWPGKMAAKKDRDGGNGTLWIARPTKAKEGKFDVREGTNTKKKKKNPWGPSTIDSPSKPRRGR